MNGRFTFFCTLSILSFLILCGGSPCLAGVDPLQDVGDRLRNCQEIWCRSVAQRPTPWPPTAKGDSITIEEHPAISIDIPTGFARIRSTDYLLMFIYDDKKVLSMEEISKEAFPELRASTKSSKMTMADAGHVVFTKTTKDKVPDYPPDRAFWYWAILFKMAFFEDSRPMYSSKKDSLTVYYFSRKTKGGAVINEAVIINDNTPDIILKLKSANFPLEAFKSMIGSIRVKDRN